MKLNKLFKKIREEMGLSQEAMSVRLGVSRSLVTQMEKETKNISDKTVTKLYELFPIYKKKIDEALLQDKVEEAKELSENNLSEYISESKIKANDIKFPVYNFVLKSDGFIDKNKFVMEEYLIPTKLKKYKNMYGLKIEGENEKYNLSDKQVLIIGFINVKWEELNEKTVVVEIDGKTYAKLVKFENYEPFLFNYNDTYPPIKITNEIKLIGVVALSFIEF